MCTRSQASSIRDYEILYLWLSYELANGIESLFWLVHAWFIGSHLSSGRIGPLLTIVLSNIYPYMMFLINFVMIFYGLNF